MIPLRAPVWPTVERVGQSRRWKVTVATPQSLSGRRVELQRLGKTGWILVRGARLAETRYRTYSATFVVPTRGLTLRVFVPASTANPCHSPTASQRWKS